MRSWMLGLVLVCAGCDSKPEPTSVQRGEALFRPASDQLGAAIAADIRKADAAAFEKVLKETGSRSEADLAQFISRETLLNYADALSMSAAKEAELKAGKFDDALNHRKIQSSIGTMEKAKMRVSNVCQTLLKKVQGGEWKSGLELEFAARILEGEVLLPRK